jgi:hypothetical protein
MTGTIQEFDFTVDLLKAILWEYNDATSLQSILNQKADWYNTNQTEFWEDFITNIFNLTTANDFGLEVWSIILGAPITITVSPTVVGDVFWGFAPDSSNFDNSNFGNSTGVIQHMPTEMARLYLRLRYFQLVSSGTIPEANRMLAYLFGNLGVSYLQDQGSMRQRYIFNFTPTNDMIFLFDNYDILPRPAGVSSMYVDSTRPIFGFAPDSSNFDNSNFGA